MRKGFEYNDEIYSEQEGGTPDCIFFEKEEARQRATELNIKEYKETSLSDYSYDIEDLLNVSVDEYSEFLDTLNKKYGEIQSSNRWDNTENRLHPMANKEESNKYSEMISLSFYDVYEANVDKSSLRNKKINEVIS